MRLALCLLPEVVRPELEIAEPLLGVLRKLAHLAVGVRGQGPRHRGDCGLLVARLYRNCVSSLFSVFLVFQGNVAGRGRGSRISGCR